VAEALHSPQAESVEILWKAAVRRARSYHS